MIQATARLTFHQLEEAVPLRPNLLDGTDFERNVGVWTIKQSGSIEEDGGQPRKALSIRKKNANEGFAYGYLQQIKSKLKPNTWYTVSFEAKGADGSIGEVVVYGHFSQIVGSYWWKSHNGLSHAVTQKTEASNEYRAHSLSFQTSNDIASSSAPFRIEFRNYSKLAPAVFKAIKLEEVTGEDKRPSVWCLSETDKIGEKGDTGERGTDGVSVNYNLWKGMGAYTAETGSTLRALPAIRWPLLRELIGKEITISFEARKLSTYNAARYAFLHLDMMPTSGATSRSYKFDSLWDMPKTADNDWHRYALTLVINDDKSVLIKRPNGDVVRQPNAGENGTAFTSFSEQSEHQPWIRFGQYVGNQFELRHIKLELGSVATAWNKAEEEYKGDKGDKGTDGRNGTDGRGVTSIKTQYATSTSNTTAPSTGWSDSVPTWTPNTYLWTRIHTTYTDSSVSATNAVLDTAWDTKRMLDFSDDNLLLGADLRNSPLTTNAHPLRTFANSAAGKVLKEGENVTLIVRADVPADLPANRVLTVYKSGKLIADLKAISEGIYYATAKWPSIIGEYANNSQVGLFLRENNVQANKVNVTLHWAKLVRGTHTSYQYTPSQEEVKASIDAAKSQADAAKARAEDTYTKSIADGKITDAEARAIWKARAEALRSQVEYDKLQLDAEYSKVASQPYVTGEVRSTLLNRRTTFIGAADALMAACIAVRDNANPSQTLYNAQVVNSNKKKAFDDALRELTAALADAIELTETGGRNLFGFRKGVWVELLTAGVAATLEPSFNGIRIRAGENFAATSSSRIFARIRNLGFERKGNYTVSFRVKSNRNLPTDAFNVNICDTALKMFTPSTAEQYVHTSGRVTDHFQVSTYNGFVDIELSAGKTLNANDTIDIIDLMVERGRVPSDYRAADEDASYISRLLEDELELGKINTGTVKTGGVAFAGRFDACESATADGSQRVVRAFLNGLVNGHRPAFAAGVKDFGTAAESYSTAFYHDGSGHIGPIAYTADGTMFVGEYGKPDQSRLFFNPTHLGGIDEINAMNSIDTRRYMPIEYMDLRPNSDGDIHELRAYGSFIDIRPSTSSRLEVKLKIRIRVENYSPNVANSYGAVRVYLDRSGGGQMLTLANVSIDAMDVGTDKTFNVSSVYVPTAGVYSLRIEADAGGKRRMQVWFEHPDVDGEHFVHTGINSQPLTTINPNGFVSYESPKKFVAIKDGGLIVRGKVDTDRPVVLASGFIRANGQVDRTFGKLLGVSRTSTGEYHISHSIGHENYSALVTPFNANNLRIAQVTACTGSKVVIKIKDVQNGFALTNTDFSFVLVDWGA